MPTYVKGVLSEQSLLANQRMIDMRPELAVLEPSANPLTTVSQRLGTDTCFSQKKEWMEDELPSRIVQLNANKTSGAITYTTVNTDFALTVASDSDAVKTDDLLRLEKSGEVVLVVAVLTSNGTVQDITVRRNIGSVLGGGFAQTSTPAGADIAIVIGSAVQEGAKLGTLVVTKPVAQFNITQIMRDAIGVTNSENAQRNYTGNEFNRQMKKVLIHHKRRIEMTTIMGRRDLHVGVGTDTQPRGFMGGIMAWLFAGLGAQLKDVSAAGTATQKVIDDWLESLYRYHTGEERIVFCGPAFQRLVGSFVGGTSSVQSLVRPISTKLQSWGVSISEYQNGLGDSIPLVLCRDWSDYSYGTSGAPYGLRGAAIALDMSDVELTWLQGRGTARLDDRADNDEDSIKSEYRSEGTLQFRLPKKHGILYGLSSTYYS